MEEHVHPTRQGARVGLFREHKKRVEDRPRARTCHDGVGHLVVASVEGRVAQLPRDDERILFPSVKDLLERAGAYLDRSQGSRWPEADFVGQGSEGAATHLMPHRRKEGQKVQFDGVEAVKRREGLS